jgi:chorismate mutase
MNSQKATLPTLRTKLDVIDGQLIALLAERFELTRQVGEYKAKHNLPAIDLEREAKQFKRARMLALSSGLDQDFSQAFLRLVIDEVVRSHEAMQREVKNG